MTEFEKMLAGSDYIENIHQNALNLLQAINQNIDNSQRDELFQQLMGDISPSSIVRSPFYCEFGKTITIEDDVWIGGNVVINQGVTIGARSIIAANSMVNCDVPADSLYGGTPAKLIRVIHENQ